MSEKTILQTISSYDVECNNCGYIDRGVYCSNCGGHLKKNRISIPQLISSIVDFFSNFEDKYFRTFVSLTHRPVSFIIQYLDGVRDRYYIPFKYFFLNLSINFFIYTYFNISAINENEFETEASQLLKLQSEVIFDTIINNYGNFFSLMIIPLYVLATSLLFRKSTHNKAERATAITFLFGHLMILQAGLNLISALFNSFYEIQKYLVMVGEFLIIFILSFKFFNASIIDSIWKSITIAAFIFMSMQYILKATQTILQLYYGE